MPARPTYANRLPDLSRDLEAGPDEWIDRRYIQERLGVSKTVAWRLLRKMGAVSGPGSSLALTREQAIAGLKALQAEGSTIGLEIRRRDRVDRYLEAMRAYVAARRTTVASETPAAKLIETRFSSLPANVELTPRSLHIEFENAEDFLAAFGAVVYALKNDYEAVREFIETGRSSGPL
jgi:hypothetical protein